MQGRVAYVGLGTNLGNLRGNLRNGLLGLSRSGLEPTAVSGVWETEPVNTPGSEWFLNMAVQLRTQLEPLELLELLQGLERQAGRVRGMPNGPRSLDLDLLLLGDLVIDEPRLQLPHPRMWERRFVMEPLAEIAPDLHNPVSGRTVAEECLRVRHRSAARRLAPHP